MIALSVPATVGLMVLTPAIVELIYQRGNFQAEDARLVAAGLLFYAPGIVGYSIVKIASPSFYALGEARTPVLVSVVTIVTITHHIASALKIGDRLALLFGGHILFQGGPQEFMSSGDAAVRQFVEGRAEGPLTVEFQKAGHKQVWEAR
jgi:hypothetical protein